MANKFELDLGNSTPGNGEVLARIQVQLDALKQWARVVEARQYQFQEGILTMVGNFEALASLIVRKEEVTEQAIMDGRNEFLQKIKKLQEDQAAAEQKPEIWTPNKKIVPVE